MGEDGNQLTLEELHERNRQPKTTPVAVRVPEPLLAELDDIWDEEFETRSEFVRAVLQYVADNPEEFAGLNAGDDQFPPRPRDD